MIAKNITCRSASSFFILLCSVCGRSPGPCRSVSSVLASSVFRCLCPSLSLSSVPDSFPLDSASAQLVPFRSCVHATMSRLRSPLDELSFLHKEYLRGRTLFRTSRSINRLRAALNDFFRPFGDLSCARHAVRFNLICKRCRSHGDDLSFALEMIRLFDASRSAAAKGAVRAAKRMAFRIHHGLVRGKSRR